MKYLKKYLTFEKIIVPELNNNTDIVRSFDDLVRYGEKMNFDVVGYDDFYNSLSPADQRNAPPRHVIPFFALFHPENKKPMFVCADQEAPRFIPNFKEIVNDIIGHERIHAEQVRRKGNIQYSLPSPTEEKSYFSNKEEIMAFSWTIANELSKTSKDINTAINRLDRNRIWRSISKVCDDKVLNRYKKYIYLYLEDIFKKDEYRAN